MLGSLRSGAGEAFLRMADARKIRLLNALLARGAPHALALCADAARGVEAALASPESERADIGVFARRMLALYDPEAAVETVELSPSEPLFALAPLSSAARRLAGHQRAYLVVCGLGDIKRRTKKSAAAHAEDVDAVEGYLSRYESAIPNLEIIFL